ncbi:MULTISPECIES: sensor histidine kinase [Glycomyces]|uniref:histidine kinase n=2 Tax=Glycomyces TaxID=58113 RepID=A0A9X3PJN6_9ACTN|nr:histidine kinase [Glycomyces lechevalierae]MDA1386082.1 histidine kinase [Glycomyces lechevalierae]MDR7340760.1 signal transduction histidine kinase [Glycomyces lechevalierae]
MTARSGLARLARSVAGAGRVARPAPAGRALTVAMLPFMLLTASLRTGGFELPGPGLVAITVAAWLPLLLRDRWPLPALAATTAVEAVHLAFFVDSGSLQHLSIGAYQPVPLATMVAAYTVASRLPWRIGWTAGGSAGTVLFLVGIFNQSGPILTTDLAVLNLVVIATAIGAAVYGRRERLQREADERENAMREAVLAERMRIARELHDVLAHNLTLVNAQAGVAGYLLRTDPTAAATALHDITKHTGAAIDELRATVGLLRHGDNAPADRPESALRPVPGLDRLDDLLAAYRSTGASIGVVETGAKARMDQQADFAAYRIVQESLTNAAKHAPGAPVTIHFDWTADGLDLRIANSAEPDGAPAPAGTGHGLIGMRERAAAAGGHLAAGLLPGRWFEVHAVLPITEKDTDVKGTDT